MSKTAVIKSPAASLEITASTDLKQSREHVLHCHNACLRAAQDHVGYAFLAGFELQRVKAALPHGQFMNWCRENLPDVVDRTVNRYMAFAQGLAAKFDTVSNFAAEALLLTDGSLNERDRKAILEAAHEAADGKTLTELYRDLGVIRQPKEKQYHPPKELSPEEVVEARREQARRYVQAITEPMDLATDETLLNLSSAELKAALRSTVEFSKRLRDLLHHSKQVTPKKKGRK
ncbi:MAG TPA: hypothetical protein VEH27_14905 [Methylomirabilota bacterium]|nr:hypothetical protein [Methylomirabilota bacterium]